MSKPTTKPVGRARFALVAALYKQQLGEVIRARREALGLTQKELADRANVEEPQTVSRWERGLNSPTDLEAVARALDTTAGELLQDLRPVTQKERRRFGSDQPTQLDRIEAKLDELLSRLADDRILRTVAVEVERLRAGQEQRSAGSTRKSRSDKAA